MDCSFTDSLEGLETKAEKYTCALCKLLSQDIQFKSKRQRESVRFARVSSYLAIDDGQGRAIANICMTLGMVWTRK